MRTGTLELQYKALVASLFLASALVLSMIAVPALAFIYPKPQPDFYEAFGPRIDKLIIEKYSGLDAEMQALSQGKIDITDSELPKNWIDPFSRALAALTRNE